MYPHSYSAILVAGFLVLLGLVLGTSCGMTTVGEQEAPQNIETSRALTAEALEPSATPPEPTSTPTVAAATATPSPRPTTTPVPPTPTPNTALRGFSFCNQQVTAVDNVTRGRFSARLSDVKAETFPAFERLAMTFELAPDSTPLNATANCVSRRDYVLNTGEPTAPADYVLQINLPGWLRDEAFDTSVISDTMTFTATSSVQAVDMYVDPDAPAGATITLGLDEPAVFRLSLSEDPLQLVIDVARSPSMTPTSDELTTASGGTVALPEPVFFLLDGDIKRIDGTDMITLTESPETETALSVSPDGNLIAFCRTQEAGALPSEAGLAVPGAVWLMQADGTQQRQIAAPGINCTDISFNPDGSMLAFSVDETGMEPAHHTIWTIPISSTASITEAVTDDGAGPQRVAGDQEWNRVAPRWVDSTTLIYVANAPDGRNTLFLRNLSEERERDIGARLIVGDQYRALRSPVVAPDGSGIALEALRVEDEGADMVLLDANGAERDTISDGFWTRPLAWSDDGSLFYLTTACTSTLVQEYELYMLDSSGQERLLASGSSTGAFGDAAAVGDGLAYVAALRAEPGLRGPGNIALQSASALWFLDPQGAARGEVYAAERGITTLKE